MYKPSTYPIFLPIYLYLQDLLLTELVMLMKPNINSVKVHPQLINNNTHPVYSVLVGASSFVAPYLALYLCSWGLLQRVNFFPIPAHNHEKLDNIKL
jgi:hypothetical protein